METVKKNMEVYGLPLTIIPYKELFDWTMDEVVDQIGLKNNCTYCGVFRRQALERYLLGQIEEQSFLDATR